MLDASLPDSGYKEKINFFFLFSHFFYLRHLKGFYEAPKGHTKRFHKGKTWNTKG